MSRDHNVRGRRVVDTTDRKERRGYASLTPRIRSALTRACGDYSYAEIYDGVKHLMSSRSDVDSIVTWFIAYVDGIRAVTDSNGHLYVYSEILDCAVAAPIPGESQQQWRKRIIDLPQNMDRRERLLAI